MPTKPQNMFEMDFAGYRIHTESDSERLSEAFPNSPIHSGQISRESLRDFYNTKVMGGAFPQVSEFAYVPAGYELQGNYNYGLGTQGPVHTVQPEGEKASGEDGSTIANARGPNVNPIPIDTLPTVPEEHKNVKAGSEGGSTPFVGDSPTRAASIGRISRQTIGQYLMGKSSAGPSPAGG